MFRLGLAVLAGGLTVAAGPANAACQEPAFASSAQRAVSAWQAERDFRLTPTAHDAVVDAFCAGATQLAAELEIDRRELSRSARQVLRRYLDQMLSAGTTAIPVGDLLLALFAPGWEPGFPEPRRMGVIRISYNRRADSLHVAGTRMPAVRVLLAETGDLTIAGFARGRRVCGGVVAVRAAPQAAFTC